MWCKKSMIFLIINFFFVSAYLDINTLEMVHIIFRHGEKNPDLKETFPGDPHKNETFYPFSPGQLNLIGRQTMYELGRVLRKRYHAFLGEVYSPKFVEARSSPYPRCIYSLQLVMASLFPPSDVERWSEKLNWQPTITYFTSPAEDKFFAVVMTEKYKKLYWKVCRTDKTIQSALEKYKPWLKYIEDHVGLSQDCARTAFEVYSLLIGEHEANLTLPAWSKPIFPEVLKELVEIEFQHQIHTKKLKKMLMGHLLHKILNDIESYVRGRSEKKFHIYAGHEMNIVHILSSLGYKHPRLPGYGAYLAIEVHKIKNQHLLKVFYKDGKHAKLQQLKNMAGNDHVTLEKYRSIVSDIFSDDSDEDFKNSAPKNNGLNFWIISLSIYFFFVRLIIPPVILHL